MVFHKVYMFGEVLSILTGPYHLEFRAIQLAESFFFYKTKKFLLIMPLKYTGNIMISIYNVLMFRQPHNTIIKE